MAFAGFSPEAVRFLEELAENNDRAWFQSHRDVYERELLEPARDFVEAAGEELERRGIRVNADPRVGGSIMRIARDTRFARDKAPYKTHLDLWFWEGTGPSRARPGYWFRLTPRELLLGAGMHRFERDALERYRAAVVDDARGAALGDAVAGVLGEGFELGGRSYKRAPRGYEAAPERAELLLHDGLYTWIARALPREVHTPAFPAFCADDYARMRALVDALATHVA